MKREYLIRLAFFASGGFVGATLISAHHAGSTKAIAGTAIHWAPTAVLVLAGLLLALQTAALCLRR